jgi:hypothetical protein
MSAGNWQTLLRAHASTDEVSIKRFCGLFDLDLASRPQVGSTKDSLFIGWLLKALTEYRLNDARALSAEGHPSEERMFRGYIGCLAAISRSDEDGLVNCLGEASKAWEQYARRTWKGLPDAVCFMNGVGILRLAERTWQKRLMCDDPNIPAELLGDLEPETLNLVI